MIREARMGQLGFFDAEKRLAALSAKGDPLEAIDRLVPWESFRADIEAVVLTPDEMKKSSAGRKPVDAIVMFRMLVLQALHNLSDEQVEYQVRDRLSFTRFLRLGIEDRIPDGTTLWLFREKHGKSFYGYKNHVNADAKHKLIRRYDVSDAAVHDSQKLDVLLHRGNTSDAVFGDSTYRSAETE